MNAEAKAQVFGESVADAGGSLLACRGCGSGKVDHVARHRLRCSDCGAEGGICEDFAAVRVRWLGSDLRAAFRPPVTGRR